MSTTFNISKSYLDLLRQFPLRPIRNRLEYQQASKLLDALALRDDQLDEDEQGYLDMLEIVIADYDKRHAAVPDSAATPAERLRFLMAENGITSAQIGDLLGNRATASLILRDRREMSKSVIRKLADHFKVDAGYFL